MDSIRQSSACNFVGVISRLSKPALIHLRWALAYILCKVPDLLRAELTETTLTVLQHEGSPVLSGGAATTLG
eukprot:scaffold225_cov388-Prasinococcus_capsulatus_cf.AAC.7